MNTHITVTNGKAFHEGVEIENFREIEIELDATTEYDYTNPKDGTYPLPEGWEVMKEYWYSAYETGWGTVSKDIYNYFITKTPNYCRVTARLVRKEQTTQEIIDKPIYEITPEWSEDEYDLVSKIFNIFKDTPGTEGKKKALVEIRAKLSRKEQKSDYVIHNPETSCIVCPFCGEKNFDKPGLKFHLSYGCKEFDNTQNL